MYDESKVQEGRTNYDIVKTIGTGTFGKVYLVVDRLTGQSFALKHVIDNPKYKSRQPAILQLIKSQYAVNLEEFFVSKEGGESYLNLVMEYLPTTLSKIITNLSLNGRFIANEQATGFAYCLLRGLRDIHAANVCHRDIKPSNILINSSNEAKYCDFGSAKILDEGGKNVVYICSRYYRAPELILGSTAYGKEIDIWSLGCVLAEMLVNKALFDGSNSTDMLIKIFQIVGSPTAEDMAAIKPAQTLDIAKVKPYGLSNRIFKLNPNASPGLVQLIGKMLILNPKKRLTLQQALYLPLFSEFQK